MFRVYMAQLSGERLQDDHWFSGLIALICLCPFVPKIDLGFIH